MKVLITGGSGFLGSMLISMLETLPEIEVVAPSSRDLFLTIDRHKVISSFRKISPDIVVHCAAMCGGIGANKSRPYDHYINNAQMNLNVIDAITHTESVTKSVMINSVCAYPKVINVPMKEEDLWNGYPEETNAAYGMAKKNMIVQAQAAFEQFGTRIGNLLFTNLYGEGDNFDLRLSHIIPATIMKVHDAMQRGAKFIECWGDGTPTRDLLYVSDAARAIVQYIMHDNPPIKPMNIGTGREVSIKEIVQTVCKSFGYDGQIKWDISKPNGQPRRCLDITLAKQLIGFSPLIPLEVGIDKTVKYYKDIV